MPLTADSNRTDSPRQISLTALHLAKERSSLKKYCRKGTKLVVEGSWQTGSYTNKDGNKVYTNECLVESCEFAESKVASQNNQSVDRPEPAPNGDGFMNIPVGIDEELPFN